jgi:hypothetical protein
MKQNLALLILIVLLISACSSSEALTRTSDGEDTPVVIGTSSIPPTGSSTPTTTLLPEQSITVEDTGDGVEESSDVMLEAFTTICGGASGVSQAAVYNRLAKSPLVMIASGGENALNLSSELPGSWVSTRIELTELVVCIEFEEEILLQTCEYNVGPDVERYQQSYTVTVHEAMTGEVLDEGIFLGALPRECRELETYELRRLDGGINFAPIILWLCQFVDPTCMPREPNGNYIVNEGDTCESIAADFGVSVESIIGINNLSASCELLVGTELVIP